MSFFHSGPLGRVAIEPKTSESEGVPRVRRQPGSERSETGDCSCGTDDKAMLKVPCAPSITFLQIICNCIANSPGRCKKPSKPRDLRIRNFLGEVGIERPLGQNFMCDSISFRIAR